MILLNKSDLASSSSLTRTEELIRQINPVAPIHKTVRCEVELGKILGVGSFRKPPVQHYDDGHGQRHYELGGISSLQIECPDVLSQRQLDKLDEWIRSALWENRVEDCGVKVLRCKGMFGDEEGRWWVLQGVRSIYEISEVVGEGGVDVPDRGKIVLIGKGLLDERVRASLGSVFQ